MANMTFAFEKREPQGYTLENSQTGRKRKFVLVQPEGEERFQNTARKWNVLRMGVKMRNSEVRQKRKTE